MWEEPRRYRWGFGSGRRKWSGWVGRAGRAVVKLVDEQIELVGPVLAAVSLSIR